MNGVIKFFTNFDESSMERLQQEFKGARSSRRSVGRERHMVNPRLKGGKPTMFICGNDDAAKKDRDRESLISLAGKRRRWPRPRPRARSSRCACSGVSRGFSGRNGGMPSSC